MFATPRRTSPTNMASSFTMLPWALTGPECKRRQATVDADGVVALAAIQALNQKLQEKEAAIEALQNRLERVEKMLAVIQDKGSD
jgi:hypothetical protein